jgi:hypothetical protein
MSTELAAVSARPMNVPVGREVDDLERIAHNIAAAGIYRKTAKTPVEVFAILIAARDLGVSATSALAGGIHMVDGKPELSANLQAQLLREYRGPEGQRYDFRILTPARERSAECHIEFRRREPGEAWEVIGEEFFAMADAQRAGLAGKQVWKSYPKMMLLARCLSDGIASHCPETARGLRVYGEGEIGGPDPAAPSAPSAPSVAEVAAEITADVFADEPEPELVDAHVVDAIDPALATVITDALGELRAHKGTIRGWLAQAGVNVPESADLRAVIVGLSVDAGQAFGEIVLSALDAHREAVDADADAQLDLDDAKAEAA